MSIDPSFESRLSAVEQALQQLEQRLNQRDAVLPTWRRVAGSIPDDEAFQLMQKYGREARKQIDNDESF
jgi:hypothetical protein